MFNAEGNNSNNNKCGTSRKLSSWKGQQEGLVVAVGAFLANLTLVKLDMFL